MGNLSAREDVCPQLSRLREIGWCTQGGSDMLYSVSFGEALAALRRTEARLERVRLALWATRRGSRLEAQYLREQRALVARRRRLRRLLERIEAS